MVLDGQDDIPPSDERDLDLDLLAYLQTLTPLERIQRHDMALDLVLKLRAAGARLNGIHARDPEPTDKHQG
jgi:hypothetical protein